MDNTTLHRLTHPTVYNSTCSLSPIQDVVAWGSMFSKFEFTYKINIISTLIPQIQMYYLLSNFTNLYFLITHFNFLYSIENLFTNINNRIITRQVVRAIDFLQLITVLRILNTFSAVQSWLQTQ